MQRIIPSVSVSGSCRKRTKQGRIHSAKKCGLFWLLAAINSHGEAVSQQLLYASTDGMQSEIGRLHLVEGHPESLAGIVHAMCLASLFDLAEEKEVCGMDIHASEGIDVGQREKEADGTHTQACLFAHLAHDTFLGRLAEIAEASGKVERAASRFLCTPDDQHLATAVEDDCRCRRTGVEIEVEAALRTTLAPVVMNPEVRRAACRTVLEFLQRM